MRTVGKEANVHEVFVKIMEVSLAHLIFLAAMCTQTYFDGNLSY